MERCWVEWCIVKCSGIEWDEVELTGEGGFSDQDEQIFVVKPLVSQL
jgi:hypothetical protein